MVRKYRGIDRYYCDVCGHIVPKKQEGKVVHDAVNKKRLDVCGIACADRWFADSFQLAFPGIFVPCSNTGVVLTGNAQDDAYRLGGRT